MSYSDEDDRYVYCTNCNEKVDCHYGGNIFCLSKNEDEKTICQHCHDWLKEKYIKDGWKCDDWEDEEEEEVVTTEEQYDGTVYIKKDGTTCFGCRTGGNPKCLCEEEEEVVTTEEYELECVYESGSVDALYFKTKEDAIKEYNHRINSGNYDMIYLNYRILNKDEELVEDENIEFWEYIEEEEEEEEEEKKPVLLTPEMLGGKPHINPYVPYKMKTPYLYN
jgi:hypothetical protein